MSQQIVVQTAFGPFRVFDTIPPAFQTDSPEDIVRELDGPAAFVLDGGHFATRVVSTLVHANETSSITALARLFAEGAESSHVNMVYFVGNVCAAQATDPYFGSRFTDLKRVHPKWWDMNRVWDPSATRIPSRIAALRDSFYGLLHDRYVELAIDFHNNSGENPPYALMYSKEGEAGQSAGAFANKALVYPSRAILTGGLEAFADCRAFSLECGKTGEASSHRVAYAAMRRMLETEEEGFDLYPIRDYYELAVEIGLVEGAICLFGEESSDEATLVVRRDIESLNFNTPNGTVPIGYYTGEGFPFRLDPDFPADEFFERDDRGNIFLLPGFTVAMATRDLANIRDSILFMLLRRV